ncbi:lamin-C-like [Musca autumnalis]|uniref:lamin-C-like n=1 Tax=Musca autumnalis TaxID=221902 RepID=UPI003CEE2330
MDGRISKQYEARLQQSSEVIREQYEELRASRTRIDDLKSYIRELESTNAVLNARNCDLEKLLDSERARHVADISNIVADFQRCREEMSQQLQESAVDDKVLCGEQDISQTEYFVISRENGIKISKGDANARVQNKGTNEVGIEGWQIKRKDKTFYCPHYENMAAGSSYVTGATHEPPTNVIMVSQRWQSADNIEISLNNADGEEGNDARSSFRIWSGYDGIINKAITIKKKYPTKRKWIYYVIHRWKRDPRPSWLLKVLGAIT